MPTTTDAAPSHGAPSIESSTVTTTRTITQSAFVTETDGVARQAATRRSNLPAFDASRTLVYEISGDGFLRHMVRIIVGTLVEIGQGRITPDCVPGLLAAENRAMAGPTAPPHGLWLVRVNYPEGPVPAVS